jgi:hypothetical protein
MFAWISSIIAPLASAATLDKIGSSDAGVAKMWAELKTIFPHTSWGADAPLLLLFKVASFVGGLIGAVAVAVLVYAGFTLSMGGEEKMGEAKNMAKYAIIGVVCAMVAETVVVYLCSYIIPLLAGGSAGECPVI